MSLLVVVSPTCQMDHFLIVKAQASTTGANVHGVNQLLQAYVGFSELDKLESPDPQFSARIEYLETCIRKFCRTGRYDDSWRSEVPIFAQTCKA